MRTFNIVFILIFIFICSCKKDERQSETSGIALGKVDARLEEASGLVASINNPGYLWTLNDSGNSAEVFLIDQHAGIKLVCKFTHVRNRDWEDIAICKEPDGKNYLYVADIGDNFKRYKYRMIYRFEEPELSCEKEIRIDQFDTFIFTLPDGIHDSETLIIDPNTNDIFILSKDEDPLCLYRAPKPLSKDTMTFEKVLSMPFKRIVAGSVSRDGRQVLLKDYEKVYYWRRLKDEPLPKLLSTEPTELPYKKEPQGEAITWSNDGTEFYTLSESKWMRRASLMVYKMHSETTTD